MFLIRENDQNVLIFKKTIEKYQPETGIKLNSNSFPTDLDLTRLSLFDPQRIFRTSKIFLQDFLNFQNI